MEQQQRGATPKENTRPEAPKLPKFRWRLFGYDRVAVESYIQSAREASERAQVAATERLLAEQRRLEEARQEVQRLAQELDQLRRIAPTLQRVLVRAEQMADEVRRQAEADLEQARQRGEELEQEAAAAIRRREGEAEAAMGAMEEAWQHSLNTIRGTIADLAQVVQRAEARLGPPPAPWEPAEREGPSPVAPPAGAAAPPEPAAASQAVGAASLPSEPEPEDLSALLESLSQQLGTLEQAAGEPAAEGATSAPEEPAGPERLTLTLYRPLPPDEVGWWLELQGAVAGLPGVARAEVQLRTHDSAALEVETADPDALRSYLKDVDGLIFQEQPG